jgi:hypothetical protein
VFLVQGTLSKENGEREETGLERIQRTILPQSRWLALLALGVVFLLMVPWLQRDFWLTQTPGQTSIYRGNQWTDLGWTFAVETGLCIAVILAGAAIGGVGGADRMAERIVLHIGKRPNWWTAITVGAAIVLPLLAAVFILDRFPNSGDEFSYLFEARTLARFRLWEAPPALGTDLIPFRTWIFGSKWISQYPPGWPMVLSAGLLLGLPAWIINAVLGGGSVVAMTALCRRVGDRSATIVAVALFTLTPFYVMNAASYFPHVLSSLLILLFCLCLLPDGEKMRGHKLVAAGATVGLLAMTRYFDVLPLLPPSFFWLVMQRPATWPRMIGLLTAGFIPFLVLLVIYQDLITGSPFHSTYSAIDTPDTNLSLDLAQTMIGAIASVLRLAELGLWASPILLIGYCGCLLLKLKDRKLAYYDLIFPSFVLAYVAFADMGGNRYGPRYYFDAFPLLMVTIVSALPSVTARLDRLKNRAILPLASMACLLYLLGTWPLVLTGFRTAVSSREEPFRLATQAVTGNAIVIQDTSSALGLNPSDLVRNPPSMDAAVLYARPGTDIGAIRQAFPERSIWRYSRPDKTQPGELVRVTP